MKSLLFGALALVLILSSCGSSEEDTDNLLKEAKGNRYYGGVFRLNESEYIKSLYPPSIIDASSMRVAIQVYEGLFKFNQKDLTVEPLLVKKDFKIDETGTVYTFDLKKGIKFRDDTCFSGGEGRELTTADIKYCFERICTQDRRNMAFPLFKGIVKGADKYYQATADGNKPDFELEGLKIIDDYKFQVKLDNPSSIFLYNLAHPGALIYPKEAVESYGNEMRIKTVGTGPFYISDIDEGISLILKKNQEYHGKDKFGNELPLLDALNIRFIKDRKSEFFEFKKGNLEMIYRLPTEFIIEILEESVKEHGDYSEYKLDQVPEMATQFLSLLNQGKVFDDVNVRKAFAYALDRKKILEFVLQGEGDMPGYHGITPNTFKNYDVTEIDGYKLNLDSARYYLAKAGYPGGKGFPDVSLDFNPGGMRNKNVAIEVQKQLSDNLNIKIELNSMPLSQLVERATKGESDFFRTGWIADYPSPENFLWVFYGGDVPENLEGKSYPNMMRYKNPKFDSLYTLGKNAKDVNKGWEYFKQAEQILMNDCPVLILWYDEGYRMLQSYVKNFPLNAMQYRDFREVYMDFSDKIEEKNSDNT